MPRWRSVRQRAQELQLAAQHHVDDRQRDGDLPERERRAEVDRAERAGDRAREHERAEDHGRGDEAREKRETAFDPKIRDSKTDSQFSSNFSYF